MSGRKEHTRDDDLTLDSIEWKDGVGWIARNIFYNIWKYLIVSKSKSKFNHCISVEKSFLTFVRKSLCSKILLQDNNESKFEKILN